MISSNKEIEPGMRAINSWEKILSSGKYNISVPDPRVIDIISEFLKSGDGAYLDLGCGFGRHLKPFSDDSFTSIGLDCAHTAVKELTNKGPASVICLQASMTDIPLKNETVSTVLAWRSIYFLEMRLIERTIGEIYRVMQKNGHLLCSVRSRTNSLFHIGREIAEEIEPDTFKFPEEEFGGAVYHFFNKEEILNKFSKFEVRNLEKRELTHTAFTEDRREYKNDFWVFEAVKC